ncbi:hypothetical protein [Plantactinospora sp. GCM10030261]|uniref:hypothetical protein n=1 Tax=Plantactinospora sp. GCM10030261 TaxID=3273420 RepID=UPI00360CB9F8
MRHVNSFMLSLVLAPTVWALSGYGMVAYGRAGTRPDGDLAADRLAGLAALLAAGLIVALLTTTRLSPLGPAFAGLTYLGTAGWVAAHPALANQWVRELGAPFGAELIRPAEGFAVLIGVPLVATAFSPGRWRRGTAPPAWYAEPAHVAAPADITVIPDLPQTSPLAVDEPPIWQSAERWRPPPGWPDSVAAAPMSPAVGGLPPRALPAGDADTADLTADLLPLRSAHPPAP